MQRKPAQQRMRHTSSAPTSEARGHGEAHKLRGPTNDPAREKGQHKLQGKAGGQKEGKTQPAKLAEKGGRPPPPAQPPRGTSPGGRRTQATQKKEQPRATRENVTLNTAVWRRKWGHYSDMAHQHQAPEGGARRGRRGRPSTCKELQVTPTLGGPACAVLINSKPQGPM